ncbi:hypothetical protein [Roseimaritima multifibrata]|uniref:hypothetical protein n=1 Tax=Roseimaritima multifibrata TaxID=1930274 RepID=UPI00119F05F7|nr:hypothetical protein [Roseimaritima multifibrata]
MFKKLLISVSLALLCVGCDSAAKKQQAVNAQQAATLAELKKLGQSMHNSQAKESASAGAATDVPPVSDDFNSEDASGSLSAADNSEAIDGSVASPVPAE